MNDVLNIEEFSDKKLRTLRNNLNNRLESFKSAGEKAKVLSASHMLYGKDQAECAKLLIIVQKLLKKRKSI